MLKNFTIIQDGKALSITITAIRINNDVNGNPRYKVAVWINNTNEKGHQWTPKIKGYRMTNTGEYILSGVYNLDIDLKSFINAFENSIRTI